MSEPFEQAKQTRSQPPSFFGFAAPTSNTTYCPNQFFDVCLPNSSRGCVRLVAYFLRKTLGWSDEHGRPQAEQHRVSYAELIENAGVSRDMIRTAVTEAIAGHFIRQVKLGRPNSAGQRGASAVYELKWDDGDQYLKDPRQFRGFFAGEGNRTYIPNQFFDHVVRRETLAVIKVVGSVIRFSIGFQTKWGHRRQVVALSYRDIARYAHLRDRTTLAQAIRMSLARNYLQRIEQGVFDPHAGRLSRAATYSVNWLNAAVVDRDGQKTRPAKTGACERSENPAGNRQKSRPAKRSENQTDIQITEINNTPKQQAPAVAVAFERLRREGFAAPIAQRLASSFSIERIERQIGWIDQRRVTRNRLGMLRSAIERDWSAPNSNYRMDSKISATPIGARNSGATFSEALRAVRERLAEGQAASPIKSL